MLIVNCLVIFYHKTFKTCKTFFVVVGSTPTGCFPAATRLWSRLRFFEVLYCFVCFVII